MTITTATTTAMPRRAHPAKVAKGSDEGPLRSFYRAWLEAMTDPATAGVHAGNGAAPRQEALR